MAKNKANDKINGRNTGEHKKDGVLIHQDATL